MVGLGFVRVALLVRVGVLVLMVQIRRVIMVVLQLLVTMMMRVFTGHGRIMGVKMMAVVVSVRVFVLERFVSMAVLVPFSEMQVRAERK